MCKLLYINNYKDLDCSDSQLSAILEVMAKDNQDGMGVFSEKGYIKTDNPDILILDNYFEFLNQGYGAKTLSKGKYQEGNSLAVHSRTSTNQLGADYAHPFNTGKAYFAHNGVVSIKENNFPLKTKNDSEFLAYYIETGLENLDEIVGYYAYIRYDYKNNSWHIGRDDQADLYFGKPVNSDNFIISTTKSDVYEISYILKLELEYVRLLNDYTELTIIDEVITEITDLPIMTYSRVKDSLYYKSIGNAKKESKVSTSPIVKITPETTYDKLERYYEMGYEDGTEGKYDDSIFSVDEQDLLMAYEEGYREAQFELGKA